MQNLRPGSLKELIHTHINRTSTLCSLPCKQWCDTWFKTMKRSLKAVHLQSQVFQIITAALVKAQNFSREGEKEKKKNHMMGQKFQKGAVLRNRSTAQLNGTGRITKIWVFVNFLTLWAESVTEQSENCDTRFLDCVS